MKRTLLAVSMSPPVPLPLSPTMPPVKSYGVVGLAHKNLVNGLAQAIVKDPSHGVEVHYNGSEINIDIYVIVEYGTRIKSVASSVSNTVRYQVEKALGLPVSQVNVHVRGLRISEE